MHRYGRTPTLYTQQHLLELYERAKNAHRTLDADSLEIFHRLVTLKVQFNPDILFRFSDQLMASIADNHASLQREHAHLRRIALGEAIFAGEYEVAITIHVLL